MKCLDTRWQNDERMTIRRCLCACGVRGKTKEIWLSTPTLDPKPVKQKKIDPKKLNADQAADLLMKGLYGTKPKQKKEKDVVVVKHTPLKSMFTDMDEGSTGEDFSDLGIDLPRGGGW
jgi:hypothetical protein